MLSVIILAGGFGKRFQKKGEKWVDKLIWELDGIPIIKRVYETAKKLSDDVILSTDSIYRANCYLKILEDKKIRLSFDKEICKCNGPLRGMISSIGKAKGSIVIIIPGDMPYISEETLRKLVKYLDHHDIVVPMWPDGSVESLLFVANRKALMKYLIFLCSNGFWRTSGIHRISSSTVYIPINELTQNPNEFLDINFRDDLNRKLEYNNYNKTTRKVIEFEANLSDPADIVFEKQHYFLAAIKYLQVDNRIEQYRSLKAFEKESDFYYREGIYTFSVQALEDAAKVSKRMRLYPLAEKYTRMAIEMRKMVY